MATIKLAQGSYRGGAAGDINFYHGIPYSQPFERFQSPKPVLAADATTVNDATTFGPICPQPPSRFEPYIYGPWPKPPLGGEPDESRCGVLSIYQPPSAEGGTQRLPVIVYANHCPMTSWYLIDEQLYAWWRMADWEQPEYVLLILVPYTLLNLTPSQLVYRFESSSRRQLCCRYNQL
jgi:hypothetical protein